jgi:hypothetical protein
MQQVFRVPTFDRSFIAKFGADVLRLKSVL